MKIIDISMEINEDMLVYPGNPHPKVRRYSVIPRNKTNESTIIIGSHTGTHIDAQLHIKKKGKGTDKLSLRNFYGKCRVINLTNVGKEIHKGHLMRHNIKRDEIILLRTENSKKQYKTFRKDFAHIKKDAAEYLVRKKIRTLGVDYLSAKKFKAEDEVHKILINNLTLFEGIYMKNVKPGTYTFIGFPLKIKCDCAPARAVLIKN
jgi:arylformamidase